MGRLKEAKAARISGSSDGMLTNGHQTKLDVLASALSLCGQTLHKVQSELTVQGDQMALALQELMVL